MKILQVIEFFTPMRGGSVNVVYNLSKELAKNGHDITIITTDFEFDEAYAKSIEKEGVTVIPFHCELNMKLFLFSPTIKPWVQENIRRFDIVHLHNFRSYQNIIVSSYAKKYNVPYVLHAHGAVPRIIEKIMLKFLFDNIWGYRILIDADRLLANSKIEFQNYLNVGIKNDKVKLIYNGINLDEYNKLNFIDSFKKNHSITNEFFLFIGRIDKTKGLDFLLKAFYSFKNEENSKIKLVIAGPPGNFQNEFLNLLKRLKLSNEVIIFDYIGGKEKLSAYREAKIFITTASYHSGVLLTPIESLICGTPVIVTEEIGELFEEANIKECIIKFGDINGLKEKILDILNDHMKWKEISSKGQNYIINNLSWENVASKVELEYEDCIRNF